MAERSRPRVFRSVKPSEDDIARAATLPLTSCPRRYCWFWHSLSFDWDTPVTEGCTVADADPSFWKNTDTPCCRTDSPGVDHYEPREGHAEEDGVDPYRFCGPRNKLPKQDNTANEQLANNCVNRSGESGLN